MFGTSFNFPQLQPDSHLKPRQSIFTYRCRMHLKNDEPDGPVHKAKIMKQRLAEFGTWVRKSTVSLERSMDP